MKVLFLSVGDGCDYQNDMLLHGMRSVLGADCVDVNIVAYLYDDFPKDIRLYGSGFTLYRTLPRIEVDRDDIRAKILSHHFDLVIYGSCRRCLQWINEVTKAYKPNEVAFVDGEDTPNYLGELTKVGVYFKREMQYVHPGMLPIQFAIPAEKIQEPLPKVHFMAPLDPLNTATYIYETEQAYYDMYRASWFGRTYKKGGWDCMRHLEILACGCLPYFPDLPECPQGIMQLLPKEELLVARQLVQYRDGKLLRLNGCFNHASIWEDLMSACRKQLREHLTTEALAKRVLQTMKEVQS